MIAFVHFEEFVCHDFCGPRMVNLKFFAMLECYFCLLISVHMNTCHYLDGWPSRDR